MLPIQHLFVFKVLGLFFDKNGIDGNDKLFYNTRNVANQYYTLPQVNKSVFKHYTTAVVELTITSRQKKFHTLNHFHLP